MFARLVRAVALLLFAGQAIIAQAHQHAPERRAGATAEVRTQLGIAATPSSRQPDDPLGCPVCREVAHAGAYLTPGSIAIARPVQVDHWSPVAALSAQSTSHHSHSWQSRAPPISLHS